MRITLNLDKQQAGHLKTALDDTLRSLVWQETQCRDVLDKATPATLKPDQEKNLQEFLTKVSCQRVVVAEILGTFNDVDPEHRIITNLEGVKHKPRRMR